MLDPVKTIPVPVTPTPAGVECAANIHCKRKLHTNDEALVENKTVARLAGQSDMTPDL